MLAVTHSVADQATVSVAPAGKSVAGSSQSSASLTASATAERWAAVSDEVVLARLLPRHLGGEVVVDRAAACRSHRPG